MSRKKERENRNRLKRNTMGKKKLRVRLRLNLMGNKKKEKPLCM